MNRKAFGEEAWGWEGEWGRRGAQNTVGTSFKTVLIIVLFLTLESVMIDFMCKYDVVCRESMSQAHGHVVCRACHKLVVT